MSSNTKRRKGSWGMSLRPPARRSSSRLVGCNPIGCPHRFCGCTPNLDLGAPKLRFAPHASPCEAERVGQTFGCGIDVVELVRFRRALARGGKRFADRIFTPRELAYARARRRTRLLHLAGRFAAKEAVLKAISQIDPARVLAMRQVEVRNDRLGRPSIILRDGHRGRLAVHVSLSHVETVAVASAIAINFASRNLSPERRWRAGTGRRRNDSS